MKHLKRIDELYKSTYKSAAEKLKKHHPKRSNDIMDWAKKKGKSDISKDSVYRIYPQAFIFNNNRLFKRNSPNSIENADHLRLEDSFYIIGADESRGLMRDYSGIKITMMNSWNEKIYIDMSWQKSGKYYQMSLRTKEPRLEINNFLFDNRNDAKHLVRFIKEWSEDEGVDVPKLSVNDMYYSE